MTHNDSFTPSTMRQIRRRFGRRKHDWQASSLILLVLMCLGTPAGADTKIAATGDDVPHGYHLVAADNCGTESQTHVVTGTTWLYPVDMVEASPDHRAIIFDNHACEMRYLHPNPKASYKVEVVYVDNGGRVQRLEAGGKP